MSLQELKNNKLRSGLSLTGVAFGIFCIISVLATVGSLEHKIQTDITALGTNTIYIDKWEYGAGDDGDYPWWKFVNRPIPRYNEIKYIKQRTSLAENVAYFVQNYTKLSYGNSEIPGSNIYGVTNEYDQIQTIEIAAGKYFSESDFMRGTPVAVLGFNHAEQFFG